MDKIKIYEELAKRNGWDFSMSNGLPYFMENGRYAIPDGHTTNEDKELLATIISEGSDELKKIILMCWDNGIKISGPCSGIKEFHAKDPYYLHMGLIANNEIVFPLYESLKNIFPDMVHLCRDQYEVNHGPDLIKIEGVSRYDFSLPLKNRTLSKEEAEEVFRIIKDELGKVLGLQNDLETKKALT